MIDVINPVIPLDFPDPDIICVDGMFYMISTTMHFMPSVVILCSKDLVNWKILTHVTSIIDDYPAARMQDGRNIYGSGMWAGSLRYNNGKFYVLFCANDTHKSYLFVAEKIDGPWKKKNIEGFYYDSSLLFDDDKIYVVHGNREIYITELNNTLTSPKKNGLNKLVIKDECEGLGYEGSHIYKINNRYYIFSIHWPKNKMRTQACMWTDDIEGEWHVFDILCDDIGYFGNGVAQGGIVQTPSGEWYAMLFQDRGAAGRMPVLVPMEWKDKLPILGNNGKIQTPIKINLTELDSDLGCPLYGSDSFTNKKIQEFWEWNHIPEGHLWQINTTKGYFEVKTGNIRPNLCWAVNTLTQRLPFPGSEVTVKLDCKNMNNGDYAGLAVLQSCYAFIGVKKQEEQLFLVMVEKGYDENGRHEIRSDWESGVECECISLSTTTCTLKFYANFDKMNDTVIFSYNDGINWKQIGREHKLYFMLDHFTGARAGLFIFSTEKSGGSVRFSNFTNRRVGECE